MQKNQLPILVPIAFAERRPSANGFYMVQELYKDEGPLEARIDAQSGKARWDGYSQRFSRLSVNITPSVTHWYEPLPNPVNGFFSRENVIDLLHEFVTDCYKKELHPTHETANEWFAENFPSLD